MRRSAVIILSVTIVGCTAISQQKSMPAVSDDLQFRNLKVISPTITHDEMIATMRGYARSLGTRCEHCHVQTAKEPLEEFAFPNDSKREKRVARTMIAMTRMINASYVGKVNEHGQSVTCLTCHRGRTVPDIAIAPQPQRGREGAPGAMPPGAVPPPANTPPPPPSGQ